MALSLLVLLWLGTATAKAGVGLDELPLIMAPLFSDGLCFPPAQTKVELDEMLLTGSAAILDVTPLNGVVFLRP